MQYTERQLMVIEAARNGIQVVSSTACAGAGKTSTLRGVGMALLERGENAIYLAFNRDIVTEAKRKMPHNITPRTSHSLAFAEVGRKFGDRLKTRLTGYQLASRYLNLSCGIDPGGLFHPLTVSQTGYLIFDTIRRFCYSNDPELVPHHVPAGFLKGAGKFEVQAIREQALPLAIKTWNMMRDHKHSIPVSHDVYLKLWALSRPRLRFDTVLLDEAQDTNPVLLGILKDHVARGGRLFLVGDPFQKIYGWRMAENVMEKFPEATKINLNQSFRFGQAVADYANLALHINNAKEPIVGFDQIDSLVFFDTPGCDKLSYDAILFRTNAAMFSEAVPLIKNGVRVKIPLSNINEMQSQVRDMIALREGRRPNSLDLAAFETWADLQDYVDNASDAADLKLLVKLFDQYGGDTLLSILERLRNETDPDIVMSTAHRAKGLEWGVVKLHSDLEPSLPGKVDEQGNPVPINEEENNLLYVAMTRAQRTLVLPQTDPMLELVNMPSARTFAGLPPLSEPDQDELDQDQEIDEEEPTLATAGMR